MTPEKLFHELLGLGPIRSIFLLFLLASGGGARAWGAADLTKTPGFIPDPKTHVFTVKAPGTIRVGEQVVLAHDVFSVPAFTVVDGPAATDLLLAGALPNRAAAPGW